MVHAEQKYGKLTLKQVMAPAIRLASEGYALSWEEAADLHDRHLAEFPESHRVFQRNGDYYKPGEIFRQPDLARTLERIADKPDDFYHGALARELAAAMQKGGGLITAEDLARYEVKEREPVRGTYRGYEVISAPPPSSGGAVLIEILNILERYDLGKMGERSAQSMHYTLEAFRRAFFDRAEFMGDPDFAKIPVAQLIDKRYAAAWDETIDPARATASKDLKRPAVFNELEQYAAEHPPATVPQESDHTTHYSVMDADGNAVAVTTTINSWFGSRVTADGLGFLLNDEMDDFSSKPGVPNSDGLIQSNANAIGPRKAAAVVNDANDCGARRQDGDGIGFSGQFENYYDRGQCFDGRSRLRHEYSRVGECAALSPSVAPRRCRRGTMVSARYREPAGAYGI